jgi:hypothetical protein
MNNRNSTLPTVQANKPTNTLLYKAMKDSRLSALNNAANATKIFFRFTLDVIERSVRRIFGKDTTEPSSIQKAISIRTRSAKNMWGNASLPLNGNKNLRAHRANLEEMLAMHPDATAVAVCGRGNMLHDRLFDSYQKLSSEDKSKCIISDVLLEGKYPVFQEEKEIFSVVDQMFLDIEKTKQNQLNNSEEIKIILETPFFNTLEKPYPYTSTICAQSYITACEAWQLHLQIKYNKKVTILPFRFPENRSSMGYKELVEHNDNAYDRANDAMAASDTKQKNKSLFGYLHYIRNDIQQQHQIAYKKNQ